MMRSFFVFLIVSIVLFACRMQPKELPPIAKGFPTDTTLQVLTNLPNIVDESSGIIKWEGSVWAHNDSKKQAAIFEVNPTNGALGRTITMNGLKNIDWEEIAQDSTHIYIGDFGNNHGTRKNLMIYKFPKTEIEQDDIVSKVDTIAFTYPDQTDFTGPTHGHNYDCEAMIVVGDSLYLFSKNFADQQSKLYSLPNTPGTYTAKLQERFDTKGTITGADRNEEEEVVALCGYYFDNGIFIPFVWLLWDYPNLAFFDGKQQRVNLPLFAQVEGICYDEEGQFLISSESSRLTKGQLYRLNARKWIK